MAKEIKKVSENDQLPLPLEFVDLFESTSNQGMEDMKAGDFAIPRLSLLQSKSPQINPVFSDKYIEGAKDGMLFLSVYKTVFNGEKGLKIIPIKHRKHFVEWVPQKKGGGLIADHGYKPELLNDCVYDENLNAPVNKAGNLILETSEYFLFILQDGDSSKLSDYIPCVFSCSKQALKKAKEFNAVMRLKGQIEKKDGTKINGACFAFVYELTTIPEIGKNNNAYFTPSFKQFCRIDKLENGLFLMKEAKQFNEMLLKNNNVRVDQETEGEPF